MSILHLKYVFSALKISSKKWWAKDPFKESAVIAYYAIFSLPGLLVVIVTVAGYFFGQEAVNGQLASQITSTMGADTAQQIQDIIAKGTESKNSLLATIIGAITILVGATGVFTQFQKSINTIWEVKADETKSGILSLLKARLFSFGLIIAIAFILIASLVISAILSALGTWITNYFSESLLIIVQVINIILSLSILAVLFAFMFKYFPDAKIKWRHVWIGSFVTAFLFEIGKAALGLYFGKADPSSGYGAAGSIILIMLWVSYSSMIVFFGAEFTHAYAKLKDGKIPPDKNARSLIK
ncbi:MAG TPA: YihY/virulence factor BrkB family protein [Paludibacter sp.]